MDEKLKATMLAALTLAYQKLGYWMDEDKWDSSDEATMEEIWAAIEAAEKEQTNG